MKTTWNELLTEARELAKDQTAIVAVAPEGVDLNKRFDNGYGGEEGEPFCAWSETHIYFPICYDGSEWVGAAPRNPCDYGLGHQGG